MAIKKVYFYSATLIDESKNEVSNQELKNKIVDIINKNGYDNGNYRSLDISLPSEELHVVLDVFKFEEDRLFVRLSKQKPNSSVIQRNYRTFKKEDVLPSGTEKINGIELYTFGVLEYKTGIFSIVSAQGAPRIKAVSNLFELYMKAFTLELTAIPNINGIDVFYNGIDPEISQIAIEIPLSDASTLEYVFGWDNDQCLQVLGNRNLRMDVTIKGEPRSFITYGKKEARNIVNKIKTRLPSYNKAKLRGKIEKERMQDYNFFEENFAYTIDVADYRIDNYDRVYHTVEELVELYFQNLVGAYRENETILRTATGR